MPNGLGSRGCDGVVGVLMPAVVADIPGTGNMVDVEPLDKRSARLFVGDIEGCTIALAAMDPMECRSGRLGMLPNSMFEAAGARMEPEASKCGADDMEVRGDMAPKTSWVSVELNTGKAASRIMGTIMGTLGVLEPLGEETLATAGVAALRCRIPSTRNTRLSPAAVYSTGAANADDTTVFSCIANHV